MPGKKLFIAAFLLAAIAVANLVVAGQPWGVVYGLGLWGAKMTAMIGVDVGATGFWSETVHNTRLHESLLTDVTTVTNIGLIVGAFIVMRWRQSPDPQIAPITKSSWLVIAIGGLILGYSARVAFGCNVGAFFSGVATGSLHGWAWFFAAFAGSMIGIRLRNKLIVPLASI